MEYQSKFWVSQHTSEISIVTHHALTFGPVPKLMLPSHTSACTASKSLQWMFSDITLVLQVLPFFESLGFKLPERKVRLFDHVFLFHVRGVSKTASKIVGMLI